MTNLDRPGALQRLLDPMLADASIAVAAWQGPDHEFVYANDSYLRLFDRSEVIGQKLRDVFADAEPAARAAWQAWDRVYETGEPATLVDHPQPRIRRDGSHESRAVSCSLSSTRDERGSISGVLAIVQVRASVPSESLAARLAESERRLRSIHQVSPIGLIHYRALRDEQQRVYDFELLYQNEAAARLNHFPAGENVDGLTLRAMFPSVYGSELWERHVAALSRREPDREEVYYADERVGGWYRIARACPDQNELVILFEDVTESRRALEMVREQAATNEILLRVAGAISELDLDTVVQKVTDEATNICHAEFGAFFYNNVDPRGEAYMLYTLAGVAKEAFAGFPMPRNTAVFGPTFRGERIVRSADITREREYGQSAPYHGMPPGHLPVRSYLAVPVISRDGRVLGGLFFGHREPGRFSERDEHTVTAIAKQAAVAIDNARLYDLARRERTVAESASRMKDDFLATISHELRTPLQSILGWAHMLRSGKLSDATAARALEAVERNARAQAALVEDILDVSRIISGKLRIDVAPVRVGDVVQAAIETVRPAAEARGIRLSVVIDADAGTVMGDENRLQQVVWNLLINAVKFSPKGARVYVSVRRERSAVEIVVSDNGQGIAPEFLPHVFERFRQFDSGYTRKTGGLGLGLSIVKHVVELHGGTVTAASEGEGKGATFTVSIPVAPVVANKEPTSTVNTDADVDCPPAIDGLRVLVVDDEEDARELLRTVLEHCRAEVSTAASSPEALSMLQRSRPDVLVSDIGMPGEDGYTLIEKVRSLPPEQGGRTPAIALTAFARSDERTKALRKGFNHHVAKPVNIQELLVVIANVRRNYAQ